MPISHFLKKLFTASEVEEISALEYHSSIDPLGLRLSLPADLYHDASQGRGMTLTLHQQMRMQMLLEEGVAQTAENGIFLAAEDAAALDNDSRYVFDCPPVWSGGFKLQTKGISSHADFALSLHLEDDTGELIRHYTLDGVLLKLSEDEIFLPSALQWSVLNAVQQHQQITIGERSEYANLNAIHQIIQAAQAGLQIDRAAFNDFDIVQPQKIGLAIDVQADGSLVLEPSFGKGLDQVEVAKRLGQIKPEGAAQSLRVGKTLVLLDEERLSAAHEIIKKRHIPLSQRKQFFATPSAFIDASTIILDAGFSMRVKGVGPFQHAYFGETGANAIDWFAQNQTLPDADLEQFIQNFAKPPQLLAPDTLPDMIKDPAVFADLKQKLVDAQTTNASVLRIEDMQIDISDPSKIKQAIETLEEKFANVVTETEDTGAIAIDIHLNDTDTDFGDEFIAPPKDLQYTGEIDYNLYNRTPFPHQLEGISWMIALAAQQGCPAEQRIHGGLLADDMGLGKTYMAIIGIREMMRVMKTNLPVLVVAPLSLLENWQREVEETYKTPFFKRIIILQADGDLPQYRIQGMGVETKQHLQKVTDVDIKLAPPTAETIILEVPPWEDAPDEMPTLEQINAANPETDNPIPIATATSAEEATDFYPEHALKLGTDWALERLDLPGTLVLTTYQTLRDYQFSLASVPWSVAVFDEAQNIKSPNTLQTRAAKALNAQFKLLVTGTPVENHLGEFWCLFDTVQAGFLDSYQTFRQDYMTPILKAPASEADAVRQQIGQQLRERIGGFMLRRNKEDHLKSLPKKRIILGDYNEEGDFTFDPRISLDMQGDQRLRYEEVVDVTVDSFEQEQSASCALAGLQKLRNASLHPSLLNDLSAFPLTADSARQFFECSGKMCILLTILDDIFKREEKVLIFVVNKRLQTLLALGVSKIYNVQVPIINGETKAVTKNPNNPTRQSLIDDFQAKAGFGVLVISPVAAGVGLTITAANNVIHLERHWNPAKEAQATDRAYRIGQTKEVNVYIPILTHPDYDSFDVNLNRLLMGKSALHEAIIAHPDIQVGDFLQAGILPQV